MLTNGNWTYTWNGENRMVQAVNGNTKLQFAYDYMGRRVEKKVFDGDTVVSHKRFVYDNYKQVEELDALNSNSVLKRYSWQPEAVGQDVPLSMTDVATAKNYAYTLDANKNVSDLTDAQGNVVAHYEYSPFGTHTAIGSYTGNPFRFSSEVFDSETGLIYYNYRYYNPNLGRWINRDPIGELGGKNLYSISCSINAYDKNGLSPRKLSPYSRECKDLERKIDNIKKQIQKRQKELEDDYSTLPETCPGDDIKPSKSRNGHRRLIKDLEELLKQRQDQYNDKCGGPPLPEPMPVPVPAPASVPNTNWMPAIIVTAVAIGVVVTIAFPPSAVRYGFGIP